jgi:hypothetical protein
VRESFTTADGRLPSYTREGEGLLLVCHPGGPGFSSRRGHFLFVEARERCREEVCRFVRG